jgi:hypothetical protein
LSALCSRGPGCGAARSFQIEGKISVDDGALDNALAEAKLLKAELGYRFGADEKPLSPLDVEVLTVVRGPSRFPRRPVERSRPGFSNVTIVGPRWW